MKSLCFLDLLFYKAIAPTKSRIHGLIKAYFTDTMIKNALIQVDLQFHLLECAPD